MIETVLFDLDGTIIDTNELIIESFLYVLKEHASLDFTREHIIPHMGKTLEKQFSILTGWEDVGELCAAYRVYNRKRHDEMVKEFPHVMEVVQRLHEEGYKLGVVTTKIRESTERVLKLFELQSYMGMIITVDDVEHAKPHPEPVLKAMAALGADPATTCMVGDSPADIEAANAAGVVSVAVSWSLKGEQVLSQYHPDHVIHDMRDLYSIVGME